MTEIDRTRLPPLVSGRRIRNLVARLRNTLGFFQGLRREFGGIVLYRILRLEFCLISDPELIEEVLYAKRSSFEKGLIYKRGLLLSGSTVVTADGEEHKRLRRIVQPYFHRKTLATYTSIMAERAVALRESWRDGERLDIVHEARKHTLSVSQEIFFGNTVRIGAETVPSVVKLAMIDAGLAIFPSRSLRLLILNSCRRLQQAYAGIAEQVRELSESARTDGGHRTDLVAHLARATDEDGEFALNEKDVLDSVIEMILASFLTSTATLAWTTYHLALNPSVRERLEQEVDEVLDGRTPTLEDYDRLSYTRAAIAEALRLAPPVYFIGRRVVSDCTIGGYFIPANTYVQLFFFENQRDERYFPQAEQFRPERWLEDQPPRPRCSYMPFGSGTRDCAGEGFAQVNLAFSVASIAQRWRLDLVSEEIPKFNTLMGYSPRNGIPVRGIAR